MMKKNLGAVTAYAIAKKNGFVGTEQEWLDSLKAPETVVQTVEQSLTEAEQAQARANINAKEEDWAVWAAKETATRIPLFKEITVTSYGFMLKHPDCPYTNYNFLVPGTVVLLNIDGTVYSGEVKALSESDTERKAYVGNLSLGVSAGFYDGEAEDTGENYFLYVYDHLTNSAEDGVMIVFGDSDSHVVSAEADLFTPATLPEKFLPDSVVTYAAQEKTDEEKAQARTNINAARAMTDTEVIDELIAADLLPAVYDANGAILTDNSGNVILRY